MNFRSTISRFLVLQISLLFLSAVALHGQTKIVTVAGSRLVLRGAGGPATSASLFSLGGVAVDASGNTYAADRALNRVVRISPSGILKVFAGTGSIGPPFNGDGGPATKANLNAPYSVALDNAGNVYIAEFDNNAVRKVTPEGTISTVAGGVLQCCPGTGDGGPALGAYMSPVGVAFDSTGNMYISDAHFNRVRKVNDAGTISTVAGSGQEGQPGGFSGDGGPATAATLNGVNNVAFDSVGNFYIADESNNRVRKVNTKGIITTIAGNGLGGGPLGNGGPAKSARVQGPTGVVVDSADNVYISEAAYITRVDTSGLIWIVAGGGSNGLGDGGPATAAQLNGPQDVAFDSTGNIYIAETYRVRKENTSGIIDTIAGNGQGNYFGDGGKATAAGLDTPTGVVIDKNGNLFIADQTENRIRKVSATGIITTIAGNGTAGSAGDGGPAAAATFNSPMGLAIDSSGSLYIADTSNERIRKITPAGIISTIAGTSYGFGGDGGPATEAMLGTPYGVAVDQFGTVYIADRDNDRIRTVTLGGIINTVAGSGKPLAGGFSGDGGPATSAKLNSPEAVTVDGDGNMYIADTANWRIRMVSDGTINTIAGAGPHAGDPSPNEVPSLSRALETTSEPRT